MVTLTVERHRPRLRDRLTPPVLGALLVVGASVVMTASVSYISAVHEARTWKQEACRARLEAHQARTRLRLSGYLLPAEPCRALAILEGKE